MKSWILKALVSMTVLAASVAQATNGYLTDGVGVKSDGLAGAGSADPQEVLVIATNPAGLAFVPDRLELGLSLFSPIRSYSTSSSLANGYGGAFTIGPNSIDSGNKLFPIPYIAANWQLDPSDSVAVAFYARGGMNTVWQGGTATFAPGPGAAPVTLPGTYGGGTAGVDLMQGFLNFTIAHASLDRQLSVGASAIIAMQRFVARGLGNFAPYTESFAASGGTVMPTALTNNGAEMSYGGGASLGVEWRPLPAFSAAAAYTTKMYMSRLTKYADLFAQHGAFDIPANATLGVTYRPVPPVAFDFDVQRIWYSGVPAVSNPISNLFSCPTTGAPGLNLQDCLGGESGPGFGWRDMTVFKLGVSWELNEEWTGRIGFSHARQPIPNSEATFNILAPGVVEDHIAVGFTRHLANRGELDMAFTYAPQKTVSGPNSFDPTQTIFLRMHQYILDFAYAWPR